MKNKIKLGDLVNIKTGKLDANAAVDNGKYPFFTTSEETFKIDTYAYDDEAVLVAGNGNLNIKYFYGKFNAYQRTYILTKKENINVNIKYVYYFLDKYLETLRSLSIGGVIKYIKLENLINPVLDLPTIEIQNKIVEKLDTLKKILDMYRKKIDILSDFNKSLFNSQIQPYIKELEIKKLGDIIEVKSSKRVFLNELSKNGVPFYRGTEIAKLSRNENVESNLFISEDLYQNLKKISDVPKIGDLLLPSICNNGEIWYVNKTNPFYFKDGRVLWLKLNKNINGKYLQYYLIEKFRQDYSKIASGTTFSELKIVTLKNLLLPVPPIELQKKFAERVEKIEKLSFEIEEAIKEAENLYNSLISKYFDWYPKKLSFRYSRVGA